MTKQPYLTNWQLHTTATEDWAWYSDVFSKEELDSIIEIGESLPMHSGTTFNAEDDPSTENIRSSQVSWITVMPDTEWLFRKLTDIVLQANDTYFQFDLSEIEHLQYTVYGKNDYYDWHKDSLPVTAGRNIRKLSFSLLLDDPKDYKGGDLELMLDTKPTKTENDRGKMIFFPGYVLHRVAPITRGQRRSLVGWVRGPQWR
jgi:PKHD-type hydroxylase